MTNPDESLLINDKDGRILRHPEKAWRQEHTPTQKPEWLKVNAPGSIAWAKTHAILKIIKLQQYVKKLHAKILLNVGKRNTQHFF